MSVGTSDTTVISSPNPEARNLNAIDASAAQRDDSSPAPKNRHFVSCRIQLYSIRVLLSLPRLSTFEKIKNQERREKRKNYLKMITGRHRFHLPVHITII